MDARELMKSRPELIGTADVLLVNLPHEGIDHLPDLLPLLWMTNRWFVAGRFRKNKPISNINCVQLSKGGWTITTIHVEEIKGFSTAKAMFRYELVLSNQNKR